MFIRLRRKITCGLCGKRMSKPNKLTVALLQLDSGPDKEKNLQTAISLTNEAVQKKARFILLPEVFNYRGPEAVFHQEPIPGISTFPLMDLAARAKVWILAGSIYEKIPGEEKVYNSSVLIGDDGEIKTVYRKIHLFDVSLSGKKIFESNVFNPGRHPVLGEVAGIKLGMTVCYDLRFPELYRRYSKAGAKMIAVPSSFTHVTGQAHWEILLRARAIENQSFILAPNQCGVGNRGIKTYGHSMIVDPWGGILARASANRVEAVYAELDFAKLLQIREKFPALNHRVLN